MYAGARQDEGDKYENGGNQPRHLSSDVVQKEKRPTRPVEAR